MTFETGYLQLLYHTYANNLQVVIQWLRLFDPVMQHCERMRPAALHGLGSCLFAHCPHDRDRHLTHRHYHRPARQRRHVGGRLQQLQHQRQHRGQARQALDARRGEAYRQFAEEGVERPLFVL